MKPTVKYFIASAISCLVLVQMVPAQAAMPEAERLEMLAMVTNINRSTLAYRAAATQRMLDEANFFSARLKLPTPHPIQITDVQYPMISLPWYGLIRETNARYPETIFSTNIFDSSIPREARLRALKIGVSGVIETTNFFFSFHEGKLWEVMRLSEHEVEYYANDLDKLVGKPSLIDTNGAYQI